MLTTCLPNVLNHLICVMSGGAVLEDGDGIELVQRYDPRVNTWTELAPMLIPRSGSAACVLDGHIYVVGTMFIIFLCLTKKTRVMI